MISRSVVLAIDGVLLPLNDLEMTSDSSVAGTVTNTVVYAGATYTQSIVTVADITTIGRWIKS